MKKALFLIAIVLCIGKMSFAQTVTITGQVKDTNGTAYAGGSGVFTLVPQNVRWTYNQTNPVRSPLTIAQLDSNGRFSISVTSTAVIDQQAQNPQWQISFCSAQYSNPTTKYCFTMIPLALTSSQDITATIVPQAVVLPQSGGGGGGALPVGSVGDLQLKASNIAFGAAHINDSGTQLNASEPMAFVGPRPWIDVTNPTYAGGADPSGATDSTAAISAALAVACPGGYTYPPNACNASVYFPRGDYKVTQPTGNNNPVFNNALASGAYLFSDSISPGSINQGAATPPQSTITVSNCSTSVGLGPVFMVGYGASNVNFANLSIRGCNEAVYNQRGSFVWFTNVWLQAQRLSASPTGAANPGTAPWYHSPYVGEDTLDTFFTGGGLQSFGTGYPSMMLTGDDCGGDPGICPNLVGILWLTNVQLEGGPVYYLQSSDITGSPPGGWNFTNVIHESGDGPVMVITNTNNAKTYQVGPINLQNFGVADNQAATGYPIVQFSVNDSTHQSGMFGFTSRQSGSGGTSPILQMLYDTNITGNLVVEGCYVTCSNAVVDGSGNAIGNGVQMMFEGMAATTDTTSGNGHLINTAPGVMGNSSSLGSSFEAIQSGSNFASYGLDASAGVTFGQTTLPGWQAALGAPSNIQNGIPEVDLNFAANYPPSNVAGTPSNSGGTLPAGTYYIYMVSTTGDCVTSTNSAYSAPSNIAGPFTITGSTGSIALTWNIAITGLSPITGYCEFINDLPQYNSNLNSGPNPLISGSSTTSYTLTSGAGNVGAGAFPIVATLQLADQFTPISTVLSHIGSPKVTAAVPWNPDCIASTLCGSIFEPLPFVTDTFQRANALTAGVNWGQYATTAGWDKFTIVSDSVQPVSGGNPATQPYVGITALADQWVQGTIGNFLNGASDSVGVNVRQDNTGANTEYQFECSNGASAIVKYISGSPTNLVTGGPSCASGNVLQLIAVGTNLFASINGSQVLATTDSSITAGYPGLEVFGGTGGSRNSFTSFTGGSMTIGRGGESLFGQQNWWSGEQDFYGAVKFPNILNCNTSSSLGTTSAGVVACNGGGGGGGGVTSLNALTGGLSIVAGSGISVTPSGSSITVANTASGPTFATIGTNNGLQNILNFITSVTNSCGLTNTPVNPAATGNEREEITGTTTSACGGSGLASPTAHTVLLGEGASPFTPLTMAADTILQGQGSGVDPAALALTNCVGANAYNTSTHNFVCNALPGNTPSVSHQWINSYNSGTGVFTQTQPAYSDISGTPTLYNQTMQIGGTPQTQEPTFNIVCSTNMTCTPSLVGSVTTLTLTSSATAATAFSAITSATNTSAAMLVGTGASLGVTGSGTIAATTAAALAGTPTLCTTGQAPTGILPSGNATGCAALGGSGTVTSFSAGNANPLFTTAVSTATTTPALSFSITTQNANIVYAGPTTGSAATPTFRALVAADIPTGISITGNAATATAAQTTPTLCNTAQPAYGITATFNANCVSAVGIAYGGSGQTTQQAAFDALGPTATRAGDVIYWNGTHYVTLAGNNSGTQIFSENSSGVPSWAAALTSSLTSAHLLVGNGSNVATDTAITGNVTISNSGVTTIGATQVTNAMLAGSIAASKLIGTDIATVGTITSGTWNGSIVASNYGGTGSNSSASTGVPYVTAGTWGFSNTIPAAAIWNGTVIGSTYGGTGVNNGSSTITLGGNLSFAGGFTTAFTVTGNTALTLPTSGTLCTTATCLASYPGAGIPISTGSAWGSSLSETDGDLIAGVSGAWTKVTALPNGTTATTQTTGDNTTKVATDIFVANTVAGYSPLTGNCASAASPAVCGADNRGAVVVAAGSTTVVVDTTAVTANSNIQLTFDASLGARLSVTCNTTNPLPYVTARSAGTSFTITSSAPITNPACINYSVTY